MKQLILRNWHLQRVVYLLMGLFISGYAIANKEWSGLLPGGYLASMAIFHFGCARSGCYLPANGKRAAQTETRFEEIK